MANEAEDIAKKNDPKQTNWAYGQQSHASQMHSTYSDDFIDESGGSSADAAAKLLAKKNNPKATNWAYGSSNAAESVGILSTSRSTFDGAFGPRSDLPASTIADLRASHFQAGYVQNMAPLMRTTAQDLVGAKGPSATLSAHVKADLRQSHFNVGTAKVDWVSMAKTDFSAPINPKTADLPIETMNDLRNPHYKLGFEKMSYTTTSRSEHSRSNSVAH